MKDHTDESGRFVTYQNMLIRYLGDKKPHSDNRGDNEDGFQRSVDLESSCPGITTICSKAFEWSGFEEIILPKKLRKIMNNSFDSCLELKYIEIPGKVEYIGKNAFANCPDLSVDMRTLPMNATIDGTAFEDI